jgi:hypothetical protein
MDRGHYFGAGQIIDIIQTAGIGVLSAGFMYIIWRLERALDRGVAEFRKLLGEMAGLEKRVSEIERRVEALQTECNLQIRTDRWGGSTP